MRASRSPIARAFTEQREWAQDWNGGVEAVTQLGVDADGGQVMINPDGTRYKELSFTSGWQNGLPQQSEVWSGGVRQKWTTFAWTQDNPAAAYPINPRLADTTTSDLSGNQRRTHIDYSSFTMPSGSSCSLPGDATEFAADAFTPQRRTHTDYNLDPAYLNRNIVGLASSSSVYDAGGTLFSRTDFRYDESALQDPGAITQHDASYSAGFVQGRGNLTSVTRFNVNNLAQSTTSSMAYNVAGSPVSTTDPSGHQSTMSYADSNGGNTFALPTSATDADGNSTTAQYNYDMGVVIQIQTPPPQGFAQGPIETRQYDAARRLLQVTNNVSGAYTRWVYDLTQTLVQQFSTIQNGAGEAYSAQVFDGAGRVRATAQDHPGSTGQYGGQYTVFDTMGRVAQQSNPTEMNSQWIAAGDEAVTGWIYTLQAYDWKGRPTVTTNSDNTQRTVTYGGCGCAGGEVVTARDERGRQRRTTADNWGRLSKVEELNWDSSVYSTANYAYDTLDHLTGINHQGQVRTLAYDGFGRLQSRTTPEQGTTNYTYFADDAVQTITDARGATTTLAYNARHLVTAISYGVPLGVAATPNVSFAYDAAGNRTSMSDGLGSVSYGYDQLSRLTSETRTFTGVGSFTLSYAYNLAGELTSMTNPWGSQVGYGYDKVGRPSAVSGSGPVSATTYASSLSYRSFGLKAMSYGNGRTLSLEYDNRLRLTDWSVPGVLGWQYGYSDVGENTGRVMFAKNTASSTAGGQRDDTLDRSYDYDHLGRLIVSHTGYEARLHMNRQQPGDPTTYGPYSQAYGYDQWGNRTHREGWGGIYGTYTNDNPSFANNRQNGLVYDAAGNLTNDGAQSFSYDATGQQTYASGTSLSQSYDGDTLRGKKSENGATRYYLRSSVLGGQVVAEMDASGTWMRGYVYLGGQMVAVQAGGVSWVHQDPLTKSQRVTDNLGNVISTVDLDPWGGETSRSSNQAFQPHRYTTYERDANGGDDAMMRRYHSYWNRFDQPDPWDGSYDLTDPQSFNRYAYVQNDPVNFIDPTGLDQWDANPGFIPAWMNGWNRTTNPTQTFINFVGELTTEHHNRLVNDRPWLSFDGFPPFSFGRELHQNPSQRFLTPEARKAMRQELRNCLVAAKQAALQRVNSGTYRGITAGWAIKEHPGRTVAGAILGAFIGLRLGVAASAGGAVLGAVISEGANDLVASVSNLSHNFKQHSIDVNLTIKDFNDCYDKINAKYGVNLPRDTYGFFYSHRYER